MTVYACFGAKLLVISPCGPSVHKVVDKRVRNAASKTQNNSPDLLNLRFPVRSGFSDEYGRDRMDQVH